MEYLKGLTLSNCEIYDIPTDIGLPMLEELDLSNNILGGSTLPFCLKDGHETLFQNLIRLHLQENVLTGLYTKDWNCLKRLQYLDICKNRIVRLRTNMFAELANLTELRMSNMYDKITEIEKLAFNSSSLERLQLDDNTITFNSAMTNGIFTASPNLKVLSLSHNNFYNLSDSEMVQMFSPLKNLQKLTVNNANMRLPEGLLAFLPNLEYLCMEFNKYEIVSLGVSLKTTKNLKVVSLQGNTIRVIDKISFNGNTLGSVQKLNLAYNPLKCKCENMWFRNAIDSQGKIGNITLIGWPHHYRCAHFRNVIVKRKLFSHYRPTKFSCLKKFMIALIGSISFIVLGSITVIVIYKYRWYLSYWVYKAKTRRVNPERQPLLTNDNEKTKHGVVYDAYVVYDSADAMLVHHDFRLLMEEKFGYKLHIWERDAFAGDPKVSVVADAMYASKYAVAVISRDVLEDSWLQFQINIALDRQIDLKRDFLILILLENIDLKQLSKFWCVLFTRLLSTRWCADENDVKRNVFEQQILKHFEKLLPDGV